jgi:hypothetical protein
MVCRHKSYLFKLFCISIILIFNNAFSKIIYDKDNITITEIEFKKFSDLYFRNTDNNSVNSQKVLKELIIQKKLINRLLENQPQGINQIDKMIITEFGDDVINDTTTLDYLRFNKIKNEFIINYFNNDFLIEDLSKVLNQFNTIKLPVSDNNCLTIKDYIELKNNDNFTKILFDYYKKRKKSFNIKLDDINYEVCITDKNLKQIENQIANYIENKTLIPFTKFIYGK